MILSTSLLPAVMSLNAPRSNLCDVSTNMKKCRLFPFLYWDCFYHVLRRHAFCLQSADRLIRNLWRTCPQYCFELTKLNWYRKIFTFLYDDSTIPILHFIIKQIATYSKFVDKTSYTSKTILILFKILFVFPLFNFWGSK